MAVPHRHFSVVQGTAGNLGAGGFGIVLLMPHISEISNQQIKKFSIFFEMLLELYIGASPYGESWIRL